MRKRLKILHTRLTTGRLRGTSLPVRVGAEQRVGPLPRSRRPHALPHTPRACKCSWEKDFKALQVLNRAEEKPSGGYMAAWRGLGLGRKAAAVPLPSRGRWAAVSTAPLAGYVLGKGRTDPSSGGLEILPPQSLSRFLSFRRMDLGWASGTDCPEWALCLHTTSRNRA